MSFRADPPCCEAEIISDPHKDRLHAFGQGGCIYFLILCYLFPQHRSDRKPNLYETDFKKSFTLTCV